MALPAPVSRTHRHTRTIESQGYLRDDGLWDIEATIVDSKTYPYTEPYRGAREPGSDVHRMSVRLTLDDSFTVHEIAVDMPATPYPNCPKAAAAFQTLVGAKIGAGWRKRVNEAVGGVRGCTHVRELLGPMATVAFQTIQGWPQDRGDGQAIRQMPLDRARSAFVDGCFAWARDGEMVADLYPSLSTRTGSGDHSQLKR
ncbi:MAG: DUF2889 domain-containing protein [Burkholderiaceae bacterium]